MRVAMFTDSYEPYVSGVVRSINTFARELSALGHTTSIFAPAYPSQRRDGAAVFRFSSLPAITHPEFRLAIPISPRLGGTLRRLGCDVIHVHSPFLMGNLGARHARRLGLPLVFTYHTLYHEYSHYVPLPQPLTRQLATQWSRDFANRCDLVVAPSGSVQQFLLDIGVKAPIAVIPTGVNTRVFGAGDPRWLRERLGVGPQVPLVLFAGRLGREKNLSLLVSAFAQVHRRVPDALLVFAGDGPMRPDLEEQVAGLGLQAVVHFIGALPPESMADCYAGADVLAFPSVTETQGLVILEAMAAGLPVVAARGPGALDVVQEGTDGLLVAPEVGDLAQGLTTLLADPARRKRMGEAARRKAQEHSAEAMARRLAAAYEALRTRPTPRRRVG